MTKEGTVLDGKYEILKEIGRGGMSIVYLARDNRLNKQWAVKEMKNDGSKSTETLLKGLEREANILKNVDHPVLPRIVDIINSRGTIYVVMDFIEGTNLGDVLKQEGAQSQEDVIDWGIQLASALDYLHSMNPPIIYRDMKPANVMLRPEGGVKLIDFGTATTFNVIDKEGSFIGGVIAPGIKTALEGLVNSTAQLPMIELVPPKRAIAKNTETNMQAGIIFGFAGLVDNIVGKIKKELGCDAKIVATGGLGEIIAKETKNIDVVDRTLTLFGLKTIYDLNK